MEWLDNIEVGDRVIVSGGGAVYSEHLARVERLTKTQVIIKEGRTRYRRDNGRGIGQNGWVRSNLEEATDDKVNSIIDERKRLVLVNELSKVNWGDIPTHSLEIISNQIKAILEPKK